MPRAKPRTVPLPSTLDLARKVAILTEVAATEEKLIAETAEIVRIVREAISNAETSLQQRAEEVIHFRAELAYVEALLAAMIVGRPLDTNGSPPATETSRH